MMTHIRVCGVLVGDKVIIHEKKGGGGYGMINIEVCMWKEGVVKLKTHIEGVCMRERGVSLPSNHGDI